MLTEEEKTKIAGELLHEERREAAAVEALRIVQRKRGWVSDESLREISLLLGMTPAELDAVATFYSFIFRRPVGRHVITICDSMVCDMIGTSLLVDALSAALKIGFGATTADNRFTLLPSSCLGACDRAPVMMVDDDLYGPVAPEMIGEILGRYA